MKMGLKFLTIDVKITTLYDKQEGNKLKILRELNYFRHLTMLFLSVPFFMSSSADYNDNSTFYKHSTTSYYNIVLMRISDCWLKFLK